MSEEPAPDPRTRRVPRRDPRPLTRRDVGLSVLAWTTIMGGWFAFVVVDGSIRPVALVLAVGGLFTVIWLLGVLILALFLVDDD